MKGHRWHAAIYDFMMRHEPEALTTLRAQVAGGAAGRVLEIGAGTGANFALYHDIDELVATEPDPYMRPRAQRTADRLGLGIRVQPAPAEALPFPDASFDTIVCTLVLCTVQDPARALAEMRRVLKPEGAVRFLEHVRGDRLLGRLHDAVTPLWRYFVGGCNPNRRTESAIRRAGFEITELRHERLSVAAPSIMGVARPAKARADTRG